MIHQTRLKIDAGDVSLLFAYGEYKLDKTTIYSRTERQLSLKARGFSACWFVLARFWACVVLTAIKNQKLIEGELKNADHSRYSNRE